MRELGKEAALKLAVPSVVAKGKRKQAKRAGKKEVKNKLKKSFLKRKGGKGKLARQAKMKDKCKQAETHLAVELASLERRRKEAAAESEALRERLAAEPEAAKAAGDAHLALARWQEQVAQVSLRAEVLASKALEQGEELEAASKRAEASLKRGQATAAKALARAKRAAKVAKDALAGLPAEAQAAEGGETPLPPEPPQVSASSSSAAAPPKGEAPAAAPEGGEDDQLYRELFEEAPAEKPEKKELPPATPAPASLAAPADASATSSAAPPLPPPAEPPPAHASAGAEAKPDSTARLVQVCSEEAPAYLWGDWGRVRDEGDLSLTYVSERSKTGLSARQVKKAHVVAISEPPAQAAERKKNVRFLDTEQLKTLREEKAQWQGEVAIPSLRTWLDQPQLELAIFEIFWRVLPGPRCLWMRPDKTVFFVQHCQDEDKNEQAATLLTEYYEQAKKAELLLIPILDENHWTLLALERDKDPDSNSFASILGEEAVKEARGSSSGCASCRGNPGGCHNCNFVQAAFLARRKGRENLQLRNGATLAILPETAGELWRVRYYDSLLTPSAACQRKAQQVLDALAEPLNIYAELPPRANFERQPAGTGRCGWYVLHYLEEECRAFRNEGRFTSKPDCLYRQNRLSVWMPRLK